MDFDSWMEDVDKFLYKFAFISSTELADQLWRDWYDDGWSSEEAAKQALINEGFSFKVN